MLLLLLGQRSPLETCYSTSEFNYLHVCACAWMVCHFAPNSKLMCVFVSLKTITCKCPSKLQHWMPFGYHFTSIENDGMCLEIVLHLHLVEHTKKAIYTMDEHHLKFLFSSSSAPPLSLFIVIFSSLFCHFVLWYTYKKSFYCCLPAANNSQRQSLAHCSPFSALVKYIDKMSWIFYMSLHCNRKLVLILMMCVVCCVVGMATTVS